MINKPRPIYFSFPNQICIEWDCIQSLPSHLENYGKRIILVNLKNELSSTKRLQEILDKLKSVSKNVILYDEIVENINNENLNSFSYFIQKVKANTIVSYGSKEGLAFTKIGALLANNKLFAEDLAEATFPLKNLPIDYFCIPTTPIMGEEVSPYINIFQEEGKLGFHKKVLELFPKIIFIDPALSQDMNKNDIISLSFATLSLGIEALSAKNANSIVINHAMHAIDLIMKNLTIYQQNTKNKIAIQNLYTASIFSGMASANSEQGLAYYLSSLMQNIFGTNPYNSLNIILPHLMEYNLISKADNYVNIAKSMGEDISDLTIIEAAIRTIEIIRKMAIELQLPTRLSELNLSENEILEIVKHSIDTEIVANNPRSINRDNLERILQVAY